MNKQVGLAQLPNNFDIGPTLYKCYTNVLSLLGSNVGLEQLATDIFC